MILAEKIMEEQKKERMVAGRTSRETFRLQTGGVKMGECPVNTGSAEGDPAVRDFWGEYRLPFKR